MVLVEPGRFLLAEELAFSITCDSCKYTSVIGRKEHIFKKENMGKERITFSGV